MEIASLITKIRLKNVKNRGRPIVPHLGVAILKLTSREKYLICKFWFTLWSPKMQLIETKIAKENLTNFFLNLIRKLTIPQKMFVFFFLN